MYAKRTRVVLAASLAVLISLPGCWNTAFIASPGSVVTTKSAQGGTPFKTQFALPFYLWGTFPRQRIVYVDQMVSRSLGRRVRHITDLRIKGGTSYEMIGAIFTYGLYFPYSVIIQGRYHE